MILTKDALDAAPALALIDSGAHPTARALADALGRDEANFSKSLKAWEAAGWIVREKGQPPALVMGGVDVLAALDRAENPKTILTGGAEFPLDLIDADPDQPRKKRNPETQAELESSIREKGVLQPILIRPNTRKPSRFLVVGGEGRFLGAKACGLTSIPVLIREMTDAEAHEAATIENVQRASMTEIEEAHAYDRIIRDRMTADPDLDLKTAKEQVAQRIGKTVRTVELRLFLLKLPQDKQDAMEAGELGVNDAYKLIRSQPKLADLTPRQWLILLEVFDAQERAPVAKRYDSEADAAPCQRSAEADEDAVALTDAQLLGEAKALYGDDGYQNGLFSIRVFEAGLEQLRLKFGLVEHESVCQDAMIAATTEVFGDKPRPGADGYATPWLNGPFVGDAEILGAAAASKVRAKAESDKRDEADANAKASREAEISADKAFLAGVLALNDDRLLTGEKFRTAYREAWGLVGVSGMFSVVPTESGFDRCQLVDGAGKPNASMTPEGLEARRRLLAMAVNFALGMAPTSGPALPPPGAEKAFDEEVRLAGDVGDAEPQDEAPEAVEDDEAEAETEDEPALEEARADGEFPPYLRRLAGGSATPTHP